MFLGLAVMTVFAHTLAAATHVVMHYGFAYAIGGADVLVLAAAALAPIAAIALPLRGWPRLGGGLLAALMAAAAWANLMRHYRLAGAEPLTGVGEGAWADVFVGSAFMMLAFEMLGAVVGLWLVARPEVPRPVERAATA